MKETTLIQGSLRKKIRDCLTMAHRSLLKIKHSPEQLAEVIIMPVLFMIIFTAIFGGAIAGSSKEYLPTIVPGLLIQSLLSCAAATGTQLKSDMETGVFDRFKSLPIARIAPLAGPLIADTIRYGIAAFTVVTMGFILGWRPEVGFGVVLGAVVLAIVFTWAVSWIFSLFGLVARKASTVQTMSTLTMMIFAFLSNAFVSIESLPNWLQVIAKINPVTHVVSAMHELLETGTFGSEVIFSLVLSAMVVLIFAPLTVHMYNKKI